RPSVAPAAGDLRHRHRGHAQRRLHRQRSCRPQYRSTRAAHACPAAGGALTVSLRSPGAVRGADDRRTEPGTAAQRAVHQAGPGRRRPHDVLSTAQALLPIPQLYLGLCFGWGVPMAFAATLDFVPREGWLLLTAAVLWAGVYDTEYAMVDRNDDVRVGVQSSAILFGDMDRLMIGAMQCMMLLALLLLGHTLNFDRGYYAGLIAGAGFFIWQQWLIRNRDRAACFAAFHNNNYFGIAVFVGILIQYATSR